MKRAADRVTATLPALSIVLLACGTLGSATVATAQSPGTFARTGNMTMARTQHTATLLLNRLVLIAGGMAGGVLANAETFDPGAGTFGAIVAMTTARRMHTATLLPDGRVLIVGGYGPGDALASAELFDPTAGTFSETGSLATARGGHTAILLPTGRVLVIGGYGWREYPNLAPAELYDPATGIFRAAGEYVGRGGCDFCPPAVLLHDGTVLFAGQHPAQLYDSTTDAFTPNGVMSFEPSAAATLTNGRVLFAGGESLGRVANAELYHPSTRTFTPTRPMASPRVWHTLTPLPDGLVLAAGGETDSCAGNSCFFAGSIATAEVFEPSAGAFSSTGSMLVAREGHTATVLGDGRVLMTGGVSYGGIGIFHGSLNSAELYTPDTLIPSPALVSVSGDGRGQGAVFHAGTSHVASPDDPAVADESVDIYCTGLSAGDVLVPRVVIGGRLATVLSVTNAADVGGARVLRVRVPRGIAAGPSVPMRVIHLDRPSNDVTMAVR
jgi:Galactose oxidase, central domain